MKFVALLGAAAVLAAAPCLRAAADAAFPFAEATIDDLQARMAAGSLTAVQLTRAYLDRIAQLDKAGPKLNTIIELNPDALAIAEKLDGERKAGHVRGPLHGIPILIKDNLATADRMETTAGSLALVGAKPPRDAHVVMRLREAGAVILGKTNLSEWANYRSTTSTSGWSGRGGQTRNPYVLDRSPIGSSSGSAVAVAANLCVVAIGTETSGSIMSPSSANGIVGIKPTVGLVSRSGIIPIAASQDTAGPMARTVRDAALVLAAIAGPDERDRATAHQPADLPREFAPARDAHALKGARIGVLRGPFRFHPRMDVVLNAQLDAIRAAGATVVDLGELASLADIGKFSGDVLSYEFKDGINAYLAELGPNSPMKTLEDLIRFNDEHRAQEMPFMGQELFTRAQARGPLTDEAYQLARATCIRVSRTEGIDRLTEQNHLDAIVALTSGPAWVVDPVGGDSGSGGSSSLAAMAGYPNITVPAAQVFGLPVGLSFFGRAWTEPKLIALAADFEAHTHVRREPTYLPTAVTAALAEAGATGSAARAR